MKQLLLLLSLSFVLALQAQQADTVSILKTDSAPPPKRLKYDTNYIAKFGNVIAIEPWISAPDFTFRLENKDDSLVFTRNDYKPYLRAVFGLDINYRALNVSVGFRENSLTTEEETYGKTQYRILKLRLNTTPFIYEFYHSDFKGFADYNTAGYDTTRPANDFYVKRADIHLQYTKAKAIYIFSRRRFSYGAAYSFTERQLKTKGTTLVVAHLYRMKADADSAFFNPGQREYFGKYSTMKYLDVISIGTGPGYAASFVYKKWFFSMGLYLIGDVQYHHAKSNTNQMITEGWRGALLGDVMLSLGYNGNRFYSGFVLRGDRNLVSLSNINASTSFYSSVFSIGFRFNPPKIIDNLYDASPLRNL